MTLIGATTENPYFEVNSALLSRCAVIELEPLARRRARSGRRARRSRARASTCPDDVADADRAPGRRRRAQRRSDTSSSLADRAAPTARRSTEAHVADAARKRPLVYDRAGDAALRLHLGVHQVDARQRPDAAVYYLAAMLEGGEDARFIARRMVDPRLRGHRQRRPARSARRRRRRAGARARRPPEAQLNLAQAAIYLRPRAEVERVGAGDLERARRRARARHPAPPVDAARLSLRRGPRSRARRRATSRRTTTAVARVPTTSRTVSQVGPTMFPPGNGEERRAMAIGTGDQAPEFDLEEAAGKPRVRLQDFRGKRNVLLVFHPFAFTPVCARGGARPPGEPRVVPQRRDGGRLRLRATPSAARQAWKKELGADRTRSPPTSGSTASRRSATASSTRRPALRSAARS